MMCSFWEMSERDIYLNNSNVKKNHSSCLSHDKFNQSFPFISEKLTTLRFFNKNKN